MKKNFYIIGNKSEQMKNLKFILKLKIINVMILKILMISLKIISSKRKVEKEK